MNDQTIQIKSGLERLPKDMLYQILIHLKFIDLRKVVQLNKYFKGRPFDPSFWHLNIKSKFDQIPIDFPSQNIPRWYYRHYKKINTDLLGERNIRSFSLSEQYVAGIDDHGSLYVKSRYIIQMPWLKVKSVFCAHDGVYFITDQKELYVIGYNPFGKSSDENPMYITDQVTRVHRAGFSLMIEKEFQLWYVSPGKLKPVNLWVRDFKARSQDTYYYISLDHTLYDTTDGRNQVMATDVKSFDYNRKLVFWITLRDELYVRNYQSDKSKCLANNIKKVACVGKKIYVLTQTGRLSSIPSSPFKQIENVLWTFEASNVVDFYANSNQVVTVTLPEYFN